ncbi:subtilisin-like serine protease [Ophidiomyces ophidiicola]|uniref:Subtilisin-like serine protease n=1 Tax=Ophidiomyces ophidiicola TaxID=1387563 RepID=A0ACB8V2Q2_9EURO|nr:subtilisin-like serine protease [Ophidiomyces ophidiicola]KAI1918205.1 subtilisin-like serine protease [Ophidiomyces ophidiicola]KAI1928228.1 subtilisin-like serine protease [Ophidiomyces ophidiicola]KAI1954691.1 subtilisin-like serine protease [Ophidiomyces ophidiicola]KAI2002480.1 subtilisin-like serine protease [Ophidiomyces ophidiicola]
MELSPNNPDSSAVVLKTVFGTMVFFSKVFPLALVALSVNGAEILSAPAGAEVIKNSYIVVMKDDVSSQDFDSHRDWVANIHHERLARRGSTDVGGMRFTYKFDGALKAYAGSFDKETIQEIAKRPNVAYIERDQVVTASAVVTQRNAPWGLGRVSNRRPGVSDYRYDDSAGQGVTAYIVDTGIDVNHPDFRGRATWGTNTVDSINRDCNGHGTHCAGTVAGTTYGIAKNARLVAVKVLDCNGSGSTSAIMRGLEWAVQHARSNGGAGRAVMNMSLGGSFSQASNAAAAAVVRAGIFLAVAAGNSNRDTRGFSPASEPTVCTIAASNIRDQKASFSNWGSLIDVYAPGQDVLSARPGGGTATLSGTSMAAPHVAGLGAYLMGLGATGGGPLCDRIKQLSYGAISNPGTSTTNRIIFNGVQ